jgi:MFS family permease
MPKTKRDNQKQREIVSTNREAMKQYVGLYIIGLIIAIIGFAIFFGFVLVQFGWNPLLVITVVVLVAAMIILLIATFLWGKDRHGRSSKNE